MSQHNALRKVIAAAAISTAIGLTSLAGGAVSADGPKAGSEVSVYTITLTNATVAGSGAGQRGLTGVVAHQPGLPLLHKALTTNETLPSVIGGFKAMTGADQANVPPVQQCGPFICGSNGPISSTLPLN